MIIFHFQSRWSNKDSISLLPEKTHMQTNAAWHWTSGTKDSDARDMDSKQGEPHGCLGLLPLGGFQAAALGGGGWEEKAKPCKLSCRNKPEGPGKSRRLECQHTCWGRCTGSQPGGLVSSGSHESTNQHTGLKKVPKTGKNCPKESEGIPHSTQDQEHSVPTGQTEKTSQHEMPMSIRESCLSNGVN